MAFRRHGSGAYGALLLAAFALTACLLVPASVWASTGLGTCSVGIQPSEAEVDDPGPSALASEAESLEPELLMTPTPLGFDVGPVSAGCPTGDVDDDGSAPICDPSGASMLAPKRLQAVEDARIEAPRPCPEQWFVALAPGSDPGQADTAAPKDFLEAGTLPTLPMRPSRAPARAAPAATPDRALPEGHHPEVYRPPAA